MTTAFDLKSYQRDSLDAVRRWLAHTAVTGDAADAFHTLTKRNYRPVAELPGVPYACLRLPTGGGKNVLGAHLVGVASDSLLKTDTPCALWLVPSNAIREQTLKALQDRAHPFRQALTERFGENVRVMTSAEALYAKRADYDGGAVVIVATIQAFRVDATEGRKVYEASGELMDHFTGLPDVVVQRLDCFADSRTPIPSLANVLKLRRPVIIVDEAHNARTDLSFATLARFSPSVILELTATPAKASNVLHHVSAAELKAADMIKLPIILRGRPDWKDTVSDAKVWLDDLTDKTRRETATTGEKLRPIMLLQAQPEAGPAAITVAVLKQALIEDFQVPAEQIAIATSKIRELDGVNLSSPNCPVRYVITVQALKEGWDCPSAYVLCSVAEQHGKTAVEQILGRIMRLPNARKKRDPDLNQAYAFAATRSFKETADALADGLVANGFDKMEARELIKPGPDLFGLEEAPAHYESEVLPDDTDLERLAAVVASTTGGRIQVDHQTRRLVASSPISSVDATALALAAPPSATSTVRAFVEQTRRHRPAPKPETAGFSVPGLAVMNRGNLELFGKEHFLDVPWPLETCDARQILTTFSEPAELAHEATLDISNTGRIEIFIQDLHEQMSLSLNDRGWDHPALVRWLDRRLAPTTGQRDVTQPSSIQFIRNCVAVLEGEGGMPFERIARLRFRVVDALARLIQTFRDRREGDAFEACLFDKDQNFKTTSDFATVFDPALYWPPRRYEGRYLKTFAKHLKPLVISDMNGEEEACALAIDQHRLVNRWVRNIEKSTPAFWLQSVPNRFYPDFVAELSDGRSLAVEYKGAHLEDSGDTERKEWVGKKWADASGGSCVFIMVKDRDYGAIGRVLG